MPGQDTLSTAAQCPVDNNTREKWLEAAAANGGVSTAKPSFQDDYFLRTARADSSWFSLDTGRWHNSVGPPPKVPSRPVQPNRLSSDREISTIPRAIPNDTIQHALNHAERAALPANSERDTGHDRDSGNWVYPSQEMFFAAMKRKGHEANPADMSSVVPIHHAVNERAWKEIKEWEAGRGSEKCGGPALVSFAGDSRALTPRARWNSFLGYQRPFDRHDWVVDRCGQKIEYVIDFYTGKDEANRGASLNFYLDVRPKLNSWEGVKMRMLRTFGR